MNSKDGKDGIKLVSQEICFRSSFSQAPKEVTHSHQIVISSLSLIRSSLLSQHVMSLLLWKHVFNKFVQLRVHL